jgi:hypothetical protein
MAPHPCGAFSCCGAVERVGSSALPKVFLQWNEVGEKIGVVPVIAEPS